MSEDFKKYIVKDQSYASIVARLEALEAKIKRVPSNYTENNPAAESYIQNRPFYEEGSPAKTYTPEGYTVNTGEWLVWAGCATTDTIQETQLKDYSITVELANGRTGAVDTLEATLGVMRETRSYKNGIHTGSKYTLKPGLSEFANATVYVVHDCLNYNYRSADGWNREFPTNGIYLCQAVYDALDNDGMYSNYTTVKSLTRISTLKVHKLDKKFVDYSGVVEKSKTLDSVYSTDTNGNTGMLEYATSPADGDNKRSLVLRNMRGGITIEDKYIEEDSDAVNKKYVDDSVDELQYEDLSDRPCGIDGTVIEVLRMGDLENGHRVPFRSSGVATCEAVQVSNSYYSKEQLLNAEIECTDSFSYDSFFVGNETEDGYTLWYATLDHRYFVYVAYNEFYKPDENFDTTLPAAGVYFSNMDNSSESWAVLKVTMSNANVIKLDNKYVDLPNNTDFNSLKKRVDKTISGEINVILTEGTALAYTARVPHITSLTDGVRFMMKVHTTNHNPGTSTTTLNVNELGPRTLSRYDSAHNSMWSVPSGFLKQNHVYYVVYSEADYRWVLEHCEVPSASDLVGRVPIHEGGVPETSADNAGKVLITNNSGIPMWDTPSVSGGTTDIVVPDVSSSQRGKAGLVYMYNASSGLSLDENQRICISAASKEDIAKKESARKPIVPATLKYAMQENSFTGNLADILSSSDDAKTPVGAFAIKDFLLQNILNFKLYKIPRGEMFEIKPGMIGLVLPYGDYTLSLHESRNADAKVSNMGATVIMATDWGADADNSECFWVACMSAKSYKVLGVDIPTMGSNHTSYTSNCYIKNNDSGTSGTGYAYVYYINRGE